MLSRISFGLGFFLITLTVKALFAELFDDFWEAFQSLLWWLHVGFGDPRSKGYFCDDMLRDL